MAQSSIVWQKRNYTLSQSIRNCINKKQQSKCRNHRTRRRYFISTTVCVRVFINYTRHSSVTHSMHWHKSHIYTNEHQLQMKLTCKTLILFTHKLMQPKIDAGKNRKNRTHRQHVMEVSNKIVGIMQRKVNPTIRQDNSGQSSYCKQCNKTNCEA